MADAFAELFRSTARALGFVDLPHVVTPYPVAPDTTSETLIEERVGHFVDQVRRGLTGP